MRLGHFRLRYPRPRLALLLTVLVPALLGSSTVFVRSAAAQDGGGGDDDAAEAEEPQGPEIEPSIRFVDRRSAVQIQLPKNWRAEKFTDNNGELAHWVWPVEGDRTVAGVTLSKRTDYMRAPLMRYMNLTQRKLVPGTEREGDGWVEACGIEQDRIAVWERYVEKDGVVWVAQFVCHKDNLDMFKPVFVAALDTFEITGKHEPKGLPDGWTRKKLKDFVLETDADDKNVDEAAGLVESLYDMKKLAKKVLNGAPFWPGPTVVKVIQNGALFDKIAMAATGQKPDNAGYDPRGRALLVKWMSRKTQGFDSGFKQFAAAQLVAEHYGGNLPFWLSGGLRMYLVYGTEDNGKPQKPDKARM